MRNPFLWAIAISLAGSALYSWLHYNRFCNFDISNIIIGFAVSIFVVIINLVLAVLIARMTRENMGDLGSEKATILLAMVLMIVYTSISVASAINDLLLKPIAIC